MTPPPGGIPARVPSADTAVREGDGREVAGDGAGGGLLRSIAVTYQYRVCFVYVTIMCNSVYPLSVPYITNVNVNVLLRTCICS